MRAFTQQEKCILIQTLGLVTRSESTMNQYLIPVSMKDSCMESLQPLLDMGIMEQMEPNPEFKDCLCFRVRSEYIPGIEESYREWAERA